MAGRPIDPELSSGLSSSSYSYAAAIVSVRSCNQIDRDRVCTTIDGVVMII
jgi:hypothetical protein